MAQLVLSVVAFIVAIGILVSVHEFGHFWVARKLGFRVLRFSVGFGKPLVRWYGNPFKVLRYWLSYLSPQFASSHVQKDDPTDSQVTEYWLSAIPLGGYVKLLDEREGPVPEEQRHLAFNRRPIPHRISVLMAGPGFNFLFAILVYWIMFVSGVPGIKPIIGCDFGDCTLLAKNKNGWLDLIELVGAIDTDDFKSVLTEIFQKDNLYKLDNSLRCLLYTSDAADE